LALDAAEFYQDDKPNFLRQGDVLVGVPLLLLPPAKELLLLRSPGRRSRIDSLSAGAYELARELALNDPFEHGPEYVVVSAVRGIAVLMTATCDLVDTEDWVVAPAYEVAGSGYNEGNLIAGRYRNLFYLPVHEHFSAVYVDLSDLRPIRRAAVDLDNRLASMTRATQSELIERWVRSMGRKWGFDQTDIVQPPGKRETGRYRRHKCNEFDIPAHEHTFDTGKPFPDCEPCSKINKTPQWYPLQKHRK
jgi:hypothetical protein